MRTGWATSLLVVACLTAACGESSTTETTATTVGSSDGECDASTPPVGNPPGQFASGEHIPVDVAAYLPPDASDQQITDLIENDLAKPPVPGREGRDLLDGMSYVGGDYDRRAVYVSFFEDSTPEQRQAVLDVVQSSPVIQRVACRVRPDSVPDPASTTTTTADRDAVDPRG